jgi:hypothetical protein
MHPVIARAIAAQQTKDLHAEAAAELLARQAGRSRRPWPAVRLPRTGRTRQPAAAPRPARDAAAA